MKLNDCGKLLTRISKYITITIFGVILLCLILEVQYINEDLQYLMNLKADVRTEEKKS